MDDADRTSDREEIEMAQALKAVSNRKREIEPNGACHFCEEAVLQDKLFCDSDCAQDWEKRRGK